MKVVKFDSLLTDKVKDIQSFGGNTLPQNLDKAESALQEMRHIERIWNHSHTQWMWKHLNLEYLSPMKNMRQISAEISNKRIALNESKHNYLLKKIKLESLKREFESEGDELKKAKISVKMSQISHSLKEYERLIEGALKDILALNELYNQLKETVGDITEEDVEREESKAHLQRSIMQCIRDVRERGSITKGEQSYLEQIGVNPSKMQGVIREYIEHESKSDWSTNGLSDFVRSISNQLIDEEKVDVKRMAHQGLSHEYNTNFLTGKDETD